MPYFARAQGDPFPILGALAPLAGGIIKRALPKVARGVARAVGIGATAATAIQIARPSVVPGGTVPVPGVRGGIQRLLPGGATGFRRRRRMNVANPKALKRAIRREQGFIKLARRTLKGTGFTISRRGFASKKKGARR